MVVCPDCGCPVEEESSIIATDREVFCKFCKWSGVSKDLLLLTSNSLSDHPQIIDKMTVLMEFFHKNLAPHIQMKILKLGLVPAEPEFAVILATMTRDAMQAAYKEILLGLFPNKGEEINADTTDAR